VEGYREILDRVIPLKTQEGSSKVRDLKEAVAEFVRPGMMIHLGQASVRWPTATLYEIARQFWGKRPDFTLVGVGMNHPTAVFLHGRLVKKLIVTYCGDSYPTPGPNAAFQRAYRDRSVSFENWSILTLPLRLKAAAMGLSFLPTRSLLGSAMAEENRGQFLEIDDPFRPGERIGLVQALVPDISILHGAVADRHGNTIFLPPNVENVYGAMASTQGAIVTVEKIVTTDFIRRHAHLVKLPGQFVTSVSEVPFGGHPSKHPRQGLGGFEGYGEDYEFIVAAKEAAKDENDLQAWIDQWVLGCLDHEEYLGRVGAERLMRLKGKIQEGSWEVEFRELKGKLSESDDFTPTEMAIVAASRRIREKVLKAGYKNILCGAGMANLAAWVAYYQLLETGQDLDIMAEAGMFGYAPRPGDPTTFNTRNFPSCKMLTDVHHVMGIFMGGARSRCIGSLGAGQIDRFGNINTTKDPGKDLYMVGSGGGNDIASSAGEIVVTAVQRKETFLERVSYVTSPGRRVTALVSTLGVFEKEAGERPFVLTGLCPSPAFPDKEQAVRHIQANCGWDLQVAPDPQWLPRPTSQELRLLRIFDPERHFLGKI
jgi:acyl CoA:acetate/3-ketoacid CoA transferase alpha subunit/acyl CoA:acetate/3-ketoacid CoA transferase beta subunit